MFLKIILIFILINNSFGNYNEKYRPQLHYSPAQGWMNDPNGLVYYNNTYHLFFQYWPDLNPGPKKDWGHAVSKDLFHWQTLPVALSPTGPEEHEMIWSGSAIIDTKNVTGFQTKDNRNETMVAIFTGFHVPEGTQTQWMAYSTDGGFKWQYFDKNPIIAKPKIGDFRDPKVFAYGDHFVIVVTAGNHVRLYKSTDLKNWTFMSEFGQTDGSHSGVWECTDMFPMNVTLINGTTIRKWILSVNTGLTTQYFIGTFDGFKFTNDNPKETVLWLEYGPDSYAGITYNSAPNDRRIFISWMTGMPYAGDMPTNPWKGSLSLPRDLKLIQEKTSGRLLLTSQPVPELSGLILKSVNRFVKTVLKANTTFDFKNLTNFESKLLDIEFNFDLSQTNSKDSFGLQFSGLNDKLRVYFNGSFVIDRSGAGRHDFSKRFTLINTAPRLTTSHTLNLRMILDTASIELFADNGLTVMTSLFFSDNNLCSNITLFYDSNDKNSVLSFDYLKIHQLKSIWN